ncbi:MAG: chaperone modulator CbpM [Chitinophagaceae bacterium]|uniref:MerR family transcriptional regulator n=1 Tax=Rurimicrobium arvi TaxID=2049916 RepID=A0ABP8MPR0_9BACT
MSGQSFILLNTLCSEYGVEIQWVHGLRDQGLIQIIWIDGAEQLHEDELPPFEKAVRLHRDLQVSLQDIDLVFGLLDRIETLQHEVSRLQQRLSSYE